MDAEGDWYRPRRLLSLPAFVPFYGFVNSLASLTCHHNSLQGQEELQNLIRPHNRFSSPSDMQTKTRRGPLPAESYSGAAGPSSLQQLIRQHCPSIFIQFKPPWWLDNGHLQTTFTALAGSKRVTKIQYMRNLIKLKDGGTLALDFYPQDPTSFPPETPILVILTGLTGSSKEGYVRVIVSKLRTHRTVVVNYRGCGGIPLTSPRLYTCGNTDDIRTALAFISSIYPCAPLHGLGFSLGAGIMTRYVAEEGKDSRLRSICCLACPWNMATNNRSLLSTYIGRKVYAPALGANLQAMVKQNLTVFQSGSSEVLQAALDVIAIPRVTLGQFDDTFTRKVRAYGPQFPFPALDDLYQWGSSDHVLSNVRVPALFINSDDDPIVPRIPTDGSGNPNVILIVTHGGGHLGWHTPRYSYPSGFSTHRWTTEPVLEWLKLVTDIETDSGHFPSPINKGLDGFYYEVDRPGVSWRVLDEAEFSTVQNVNQPGAV